MPKRKTMVKKTKIAPKKLPIQPPEKSVVKSTKKTKRFSEYIGGSVFIFIGLLAIGLSVNLLAWPQSPVINLAPLVKGAQDQSNITNAVSEEECTTCAQNNETAAKSFVAESTVDQVENINEPAVTPDTNEKTNKQEEANQAITPEVSEKSWQAVTLDKNNCTNYKFHQVSGSNNDLSESSIIMRETDNRTTVTLIARLADIVQSDRKFQLLTDQTDAVNCRLIFFTEIVDSPPSLKKGLFSYDIESGEFKETSLSLRFKGYVNYKFNSDFSKVIVIHDNLDLGDNDKTLEVLLLPEDQAKIMVELEGKETFNQGVGFGGFSANFGWSADEKSIFYDVYEKSDSQATFLEQRTIVWP